MCKQLMKNRTIAAPLLAFALCGTMRAAEPNETFSTATVLAAGVSSIGDSLTLQYTYPDTFLGILSLAGQIVRTDDDDSIYGDGFASGLGDLSIESTAIQFAVTGFGDDNFTGAHAQAGEYKVFVDVYGASGEPIDSFSEVRTLAAGAVDEYSFSDAAWLGGKYDVNIDNRTLANDIDFFTFTGLLPGKAFIARTMLATSPSVDTLLGWFSDAGVLLQSDDDSGGGTLSLVAGTVPSSGNITLAVSGFGDPEFGGFHSQAGNYVLEVTQSTNPNGGDYNGNGVVDAADYTVWRDSLGQSGPNLVADGDLDTMIGIGDYIFWKSRFGQIVGAGSLTAEFGASAIPEPSTALFVALCGLILWARFR